MEYPPPGYAGYPQPSGFIGSSIGAIGFGGPSAHQGGTYGYQQNYRDQGGALFGGGVANFAGNVAPMGAVAGLALGTMIGGPVLQHGFARSGAGFASSAAHWTGRGLQAMDPFSWAMGNPHALTGAGRRGMLGMIYDAGGAGARMLGGRTPAQLASAGRMASAPTRLLGRLGIRGGMRALGGAAVGGAAATGFGLPLAAGMLAMEAPLWAGEKMFQGSMDYFQGRSLMNQMAPSVAPGGQAGNTGGDMGRFMREMSDDLGVGMQDIGRYAKQLDAQKVFQTTQSAKEFRDKFKKVMGAVKEIAEMTQGTVDEAMQTFASLRQQGFYTTADIKAQAATTSAREMTTGLSGATLNAVGGAGAQVSRAYGMRGRFGSRLAQREVSAVSRAVREGLISEEEVMEMGGVEQVGMRQAQKQMGFLRSARGRALIAATMSDSGAGPDGDRLARLMGGGMSTEAIVESAAGRGLGVLRKAGTREAREEFMPYASMAMVQMAASQQRQLYGGVTRKGIQQMLGTMGVNFQESDIMIETAMQMPQQLADERRAQQMAMSRQDYNQRTDKYKITKRIEDNFYVQGLSNTGKDLGRVGASTTEAVGAFYTRNMESMFGGGTQGIGTAGARRLLREGGSAPEMNFAPDAELIPGVLGIPSAARLQAMGAIEAGLGMNSRQARQRVMKEMVQEGFTGDREQMEAEISKRLGNLQQLGGGKVASRADMERLNQQRSKTLRFQGDQRASLQIALRGANAYQGAFARADENRSYGQGFAEDYLFPAANALGQVVPQSAGGAALRMVGQGKASRQDRVAFGLLQNSNILGEDVTLEDFQNMDPVTKDGLIQQIREEASRSEGPEKERILQELERVGGGGSVGLMNLEQLKKRSDAKINAAMSRYNQGVFTSTTWAGAAFGDKIRSSGKAQDLLLELGDAMKDENFKAKGGKEQVEGILRRFDKLDLSSEEKRGLTDMVQGMMSDSGKRQSFARDMDVTRAGSLGRALSEMQLGEMEEAREQEGDRSMEAERSRLRGKGQRGSDRYKEISRFMNMKGKSRQRAIQEYVLQHGADGLDKDETEFLERVSGTTSTGGARALSGIIGGLAGSDEEEMETALRTLGVNEENIANNIKSLKASSGKSKQEKIRALLSGGKANPLAWSMEGAGEENLDRVEGSAVRVAQANEAFVKTVWEFISAMSEVDARYKKIAPPSPLEQ